MRQTPYLNRAAIEEGQLEQLRSLVTELIPANKFYTHKLQSAGAGFDIASLSDFSARFPFTTKSELATDQLDHPPFGSNLTYPLNRYTRLHQTSGTTGVPLRWLDTPESWEWMVESWAEIFRAADIGAGERVFFAFSFGPFIGFWLAYESAQTLGCLCIPGGGLGSEARAKLIRETGATVLCCTPTYAIRLGEVATFDFRSTVKKIIVAGEPGGSIPATRKRIEELWPGARVFDHHGMTETGPVTYECPICPRVLHVIESAYFVEIIDPVTGKAAEAGELILTPLGRTGSPLLRYRTGDLVKCAASPCACGSHELGLEGGILGRADDMLIVRGVNIHPGAVEEILRSFRDVMEFRATVSQRNSMKEIFIEIELSANCADGTSLAFAVQQQIELAFSLRVPVRVVAAGTLPRFEMKARRWVQQ